MNKLTTFKVNRIWKKLFTNMAKSKCLQYTCLQLYYIGDVNFLIESSLDLSESALDPTYKVFWNKISDHTLTLLYFTRTISVHHGVSLKLTETTLKSSFQPPQPPSLTWWHDEAPPWLSMQATMTRKPYQRWGLLWTRYHVQTKLLRWRS